MSDTFSSRLKSARQTAGLSQPQLAERAGVPLTSLRQLEQGRRGGPTLATARKLALALGVSLDELAG